MGGSGPAHQPLVIRDAVKRFGSRTALGGLDLTVQAGEVYALLGPNGAGKTTTINLILGFHQADAGTVMVSGIDSASDPLGARSRAAYIPEQVALYPDMTGFQNLRYFTTLAGLSLDEANCARLLDETGLAREAQHRKAGGYSKGMRQKVGIAVAIARQADLLLLDEPTSGLDPSASSDFSHLVRAAADRGTAILMATHDLYRIKEVANRVGILNGGRIVDEIDPATLDHTELERIYIERLAA